MSSPSEALQCAAVNQYLMENCTEYGASPSTKRKPYNRYSAEQRLVMAKYAEKNGPRAAARHFSEEYGRTVDESSLRYMVKKYRQEQKKQTEDITSLQTARRGRPTLLADDLDQRVVKMIDDVREAGGVITGPLVIGLGNGVVSHHDRALLVQNGGHISLNRSWSESILRRINYVKRRGTKAARKIPLEFPVVKAEFLTRISNAVREHNIPDELVINMDETGIPVVPVSNWTMAPEGSSQVSIIGKEDKNQVTAVLMSTLSGAFPQPQIIYKGKTQQCHPHYIFPAEFDVHHSPNHWANTDTMLRWIDTCLGPYIAQTKANLRLPDTQKALMIFDVFAVHRATEVREKLEQMNCMQVYIPAGCTGELQPLDVSVNKPFKSSLTTSFQTWYAEKVAAQLAAGHETPTVCMKYSSLKPLNAKWIVTAFDYIKSRPDIVKLGWEKAGIAAAIQESSLNEVLSIDRTEQ